MKIIKTSGGNEVHISTTRATHQGFVAPWFVRLKALAKAVEKQSDGVRIYRERDPKVATFVAYFNVKKRQLGCADFTKKNWAILIRAARKAAKSV